MIHFHVLGILRFIKESLGIIRLPVKQGPVIVERVPQFYQPAGDEGRYACSRKCKKDQDGIQINDDKSQRGQGYNGGGKTGESPQNIDSLVSASARARVYSS